MSWTEEKVAKLKELWGKGNTASQIAEIIGGISRNAVIGKAHRLNLSAKIKTRTATSTKNFESSVQESNIKSKRTRKSKFKSLIIEKDFEPENPKQLEELDESLYAVGSMPLPPYIEKKRSADLRDVVDYQTIWAKEPGSVAAPTASLHFDKELLTKLKRLGVTITFVTLHVGAGTFLPVKVHDISEHQMHPEIGYISETAATEINETKSSGNRVIPVGTTALRLIESAAQDDGLVNAWSGQTDIFIYPGFNFKVADGLMTNFHLPKSTLYILVNAFVGVEKAKELYSLAIKKRYRLFSYGDCCLLLP